MRVTALQLLPLLCSALRLPAPSSRVHGRRSVLAGGLAAAVAPHPLIPAAAAAEAPVKIYFGAGCFWHVQHEFVLEEVASLDRKGEAITAVAGYAGGKRLGSGDRVCYHNFGGVADYGALGHAEAVEVTIPTSAVSGFAHKYFSLFGSRGFRHDPQDSGGEYRSVIGIPGGTRSPLYASIEEAAAASPMKLLPGVGDEPDTLGAKAVLVYDSDVFPFHRGELYHQFHNDFMGPPYGAAYNKLQGQLAAAGRLSTTGCPERS